ncbi:MAG TPA: hypothetical protein VKB79_16645 [Bryobacteraceae bacterium]|nr:hypothetical protein [Bryobacteraceae bacterium]
MSDLINQPWVFGLVSLPLGFSLTFAAARYIERRGQLVDEANMIGVAYLRTQVRRSPFGGQRRICFGICGHSIIEKRRALR